MAKISKNAKKLLALTLAGVMTVGTAVPGTAMSTVQEVKADSLGIVTLQDGTEYKTSTYYAEKVKDAFEELWVASDGEIVDKETLLVKGDELPSADEVKEALLEKLGASDEQIANGSFIDDDGGFKHFLSVENVNQYAIDENNTWQVKVRVQLDDKNATNEEKTVEQSVNNSYADGLTTVAENYGKNLCVNLQKGLQLTSAQDVADALESYVAAGKFPEIVIPVDEAGDIQKVKGYIRDAYHAALQQLDYFDDFAVSFDPLNYDGNGVIEDGKWIGNIVVVNRNNEDIQDWDISVSGDGLLTGESQDTAYMKDVTVDLPTTEDTYTTVAERIEAELNESGIYVPYATYVGTGYNQQVVYDELEAKVKELYCKIYPADASNVDSKVTIETAPVVTDIKDHIGKLSATITIGPKNSALSRTFTVDNIVVTEDIIDTFDVNTKTADGVNTNYEISTDISSATTNIESITVNFAHDATPVTLTFDQFISSNNPYFQVVTNFNKNKLGAYSYEIVSNDSRTALENNKEYTFNVVRTIDLNETEVEYSAISSSDESVAKVSINNANKKEATITAYKAGTATITYTLSNGKIVKKILDIDERGTYTLKNATVGETISVANNANNLGFVYHPEYKTNKISVTNQKVSSAMDDSENVITCQYDEENGIIEITPVTQGSADIVVIGGENGKLKATLHVVVDEYNSVLVESKENNVSGFKLDPHSTVATLENAAFYAGEYVTIPSIGFTADDKVVVYYGDTNKEDLVPATDLMRIDVDTIHGTGTKEATVYYNQKYTEKVNVNVFDKDVLSVADLGLIPTEVVSVAGNPAGSNKYITDTGISVSVADGLLTIKGVKLSGKNTKFDVVVKDKKGNKATVQVEVNASTNEITSECTDPFEITGDYTFDAPDKTTYFIGDQLETSGGTLIFNDVDAIDIEPEMVTGFDSSKIAETQTLTVSYGKVQETYTVRIAARTTQIDIDSLGFDSNDGIILSTATGDDGITAKLDGDTLEIAATKINQSGGIIVENKAGDKVAVKVVVDESGKISTDIVKTFKQETKAVANEEETLGFIATVAESDNTEVATVTLNDAGVNITSHKPGSAVITVTDGERSSTINVTVDEFGNITTSIIKFNDDGWRKVGDSDWAYYKDGERVVSKWISVIEEDPYNNNEVGEVWYHFGADGKMQRGWISDPEAEWKIYLLDSNGRMMHSDWVNAPEQKELNRPAGIYHLTSDGAVQLNGWALAKGSDSVYWYCNAGNGLFEQDNPASWANEKLW